MAPVASTPAANCVDFSRKFRRVAIPDLLQLGGLYTSLGLITNDYCRRLAFNGSANLGRTRYRCFQGFVRVEDIQYGPRYVFVDLGCAADIHGIAHDKLERRVR